MNELAQNPGPGRPKDMEKRAAILTAATKLFLQQGFDKVSMDTIASEAGVSKLTVYNHFQDKETLFFEAVSCRCEAHLPHDVFDVALTGPVNETLLHIARRFFDLIAGEEAIDLYRLMAADTMKGGKLGKLFFEAGPKRTLAEVQTLLTALDKNKRLKVSDPVRAAQHFLMLIKGLPHLRLMFGVGDKPTPAQTEAHLKSVVEMFVRAYAP